MKRLDGKEISTDFALLFDLDGVLIDSELQYTQIWKEIDKFFPSGIPDFPLKIKGMTLNAILSQFYPDHEVAEKVKDYLYKREREMHYTFLPGAMELLDEANRNGIPCILVTSSNNDKMTSVMHQIPKFDSLFRKIITADSITKSKPDPEAYLIAAKSAGYPPCRCIVFEDSEQGIKAGLAAGAKVFGVRGTIPDNDINTLTPFSINNLSQVSLEYLTKLFSPDIRLYE